MINKSRNEKNTQEEINETNKGLHALPKKELFNFLYW